MQEKKAQFLLFMIKYYEHIKSYMDLAIAYKTLYSIETPQVN